MSIISRAVENNRQVIRSSVIRKNVPYEFPFAQVAFNAFEVKSIIVTSLEEVGQNLLVELFLGTYKVNQINLDLDNPIPIEYGFTPEWKLKLTSERDIVLILYLKEIKLFETIQL